MGWRRPSVHRQLGGSETALVHDQYTQSGRHGSIQKIRSANISSLIGEFKDRLQILWALVLKITFIYMYHRQKESLDGKVKVKVTKSRRYLMLGRNACVLPSPTCGQIFVYIVRHLFTSLQEELTNLTFILVHVLNC